jgi:hypothetical protein
VRQEPCRLIGYAKLALDLVRADPLLRRAHQVDREQPVAEGDRRILENRPDANRELLAAMAALLQPVPNSAALILDAFENVDPIRRAAVGADRAIRPAQPLDQLASLTLACATTDSLSRLIRFRERCHLCRPLHCRPVLRAGAGNAGQRPAVPDAALPKDALC